MSLDGVDPRVLQLVLVGVLVLAWLASPRESHKRTQKLLPGFLAAYALVQIGVVAYLASNHATFPLNLEAMELTMLATAKRVLHGMPIYIAPSPDFIPLAYNPLFYYLAVPFTSLFGVNLVALRVEAITGFIGCGLVVFLSVRRETASSWWAIVAVGLFASAYSAMDSYLDNAHADSWMLCLALLGAYLVSLHGSLKWDLVGVGLGIISFWFKQPGAILCAGIVGYLTFHRPKREVALIWIVALLFGPILYALVPGDWFGTMFHEYTWGVPRQWVAFDINTIGRLARYFTRNFGLLAVTCALAWATTIKHPKRQIVWFFVLPFAFLTAVTGAMDTESNNNVFIPLATWLIISGVIALAKSADALPRIARWRLPQLLVGASFVLLVFNPTNVMVSKDAARSYGDLQEVLATLDGPVYAPWIGPLQRGYEFNPTVHWVPMTDLVRRPGLSLTQNAFIHDLLTPVIHPSGHAYLLMNFPLQDDSALAFLRNDYVLVQDFGNRFEPLSALPRRYDILWPRYLYAYQHPSSP